MRGNVESRFVAAGVAAGRRMDQGPQGVGRLAGRYRRKWVEWNLATARSPIGWEVGLEVMLFADAMLGAIPVESRCGHITLLPEQVCHSSQ
jgi:hypothetical protein